MPIDTSKEAGWNNYIRETKSKRYEKKTNDGSPDNNRLFAGDMTADSSALDFNTGAQRLLGVQRQTSEGG